MLLPSWVRPHPQVHLHCWAPLHAWPLQSLASIALNLKRDTMSFIGCWLRWCLSSLAQCPRKHFWILFYLYPRAHHPSANCPSTNHNVFLLSKRGCSLVWWDCLGKMACMIYLCISDLTCPFLEINPIFLDQNHHTTSPQSRRVQHIQFYRHSP